MTWFDLAIVLNALSLVAALFATGGLMVLATMLIQDPRGSDRFLPEISPVNPTRLK